mgnify:CR=1 FL=1
MMFVLQVSMFRILARHRHPGASTRRPGLLPNVANRATPGDRHNWQRHNL